MRTSKQVKAITAQLEVLEELKEQLQVVLANINDVIQKGMSWIEEIDHKSFKEINHLLANETSDCLQQCLNLATGNEEMPQASCTRENDKGAAMSVGSLISMSSSTTTHFTENQKLTEKINGVEKQFSKHSKTLKTLKQNFIEQAKETAEAIEKLKVDMDIFCNLKFKEVMTELQAASNFISDVQTQNELLTNQVNDTKKHQHDMEQKLNIREREHANTIKLEEISGKVSNNCEDINEIKHQTGSFLTSLREMQERLDEMSSIIDPVRKSFEIHAEREDLKLKIENVSTKVEEILQCINKIESTDLSIGFDASAEECYIFCEEDQKLTCFTSIIQDMGNYFDTMTGVFTVPSNGIYLCALFIELKSPVKHDIVFDICIKESEVNDAEENDGYAIGRCHSKFAYHTVCDITIRKLQPGDELYITSKSEGQELHFSKNSHFICVLLNPV